jgi:hypothetical protein
MSMLSWKVAMVRSAAVRSAPNWAVAGLSVLDLAAAAVLSIGAVTLSSGIFYTSHQHGGLAASLGLLAMTAPVAIRRRYPLVASGMLAAGAVANGLAFGQMVRCGAALPAVFLVGYGLGAWCDRATAAAGLMLCAVNVAAQGFWDPRLGHSALGPMLPVLAAFFATGRLVRSRDQAAQSLRQRSEELRYQREQTARVAVLADRARVAGDLTATLHAQIGHIAAAAAAELGVAHDDPASMRRALTAIEQRGRGALRQMREVLGNLSEEAHSGPQPTLDQLPNLLRTSTTAAANLTVQGSPRALPVGLELSGYRIVEHLLAALDDAPHSTVDVGLRYSQDALELRVSGSRARDADLAAVITTARERAALHGGTVDGSTTGGRCVATARLPLISGHA